MSLPIDPLRISCECEDHENSGGCVENAYALVVRMGSKERLRVCDHCDHSTDESCEPLTTDHLTPAELEQLAQLLERRGTEMVQRSIAVTALLRAA